MRQRRTVSFSKNTLSQLFFAIGEILKGDSEESKLLYNKILKGVDPEHKMSFESSNFFDKDISQDVMRTTLEGYDLKQLKETIRGSSLDPNRQTAKWKDKDKLIEFILKTRENLMIKFNLIS